VALTTSQILSANRRVFGSGSFSHLASGTVPKDLAEEYLDEEKRPDAREPGKSILSRFRSGATSGLQTLGRGAAAGMSSVIAGSKQIGLGLKGEASLDEFRRDFNRRIGVGDILEENTLTTGLPMNVKRGLGIIGDVAVDPLNFVTLGAGTAAKHGARRLAAEAGEDVAQAARRSVGEADSLIAQRFGQEQAEAAAQLAAREQAAAAAAARPTQLNLLDDAAGAVPDIARPAILDAPTPTVRSILGEGTSPEAVDRVLRSLERTGQGGIGLNFGRFGSPNLVKGETIGKLPLGRGPLDKLRGSGVGVAGRRALVAGSETKDAFGAPIADSLSSIGHARDARVAIAKQDIDNRIRPLLKSSAYDSPAADTVRNALDQTGSTEAARAMLQDNPEGLKFLDELVSIRDEAYSTLVEAGKPVDTLMAKDDYIRHMLTAEFMQKQGLTRRGGKPGTQAGKTAHRTVEGTIDEKNAAALAEFGIAAYIDDPLKLARASAHWAHEVGGNAFMADALEEVALKAAKVGGLKPGVGASDIIRRSAKDGFHEIAPGRWVASEIYNDLVNVGRAGTQNAAVKGWDEVSGLLKRHTLFNVVSFPPYIMQNIATGVFMNAADGAGPLAYARIARLRQASNRAFAEGGKSGYDDALRQILRNPEDVALTQELRQTGIFGAGHSLYTDVAQATPLNLDRSVGRRIAETGTQTTAKANQWVEEVLRGVSYTTHRGMGATPDLAANYSRLRHLDYTGRGRSAFERNIINRFVFFPTWLFKAPSRIVRAYAHSPGAAAATLKTEMGTQWYDRERNNFGDLIGPRISGTMSFMAGLGHDVGSNPLDILNPAASFALQPEGKGITDIIPPLANVLDRRDPVGGGFPGGRLGGVLEDDAKRSRYLRSAVGVRTGVDYGAEKAVERFHEELETRAQEREEQALAGERVKSEFSPKQRLVFAALEQGIEQPYSMTSGELARALRDRGLNNNEINVILRG
jgi:hypothetical protein